MPARFWGEAVTTAVFNLNSASTKTLKGKTPFEAWYGRKPSVSFLRTFGCIGHVRKTKPVLTKLEDRSTPMVLLGYKEGTKTYRLYDPRGGKVVVSRDVVFDEKAAWDWDSPGTGEAGGFTSTSVVKHLVIHGGGDVGEEVPTTPATEPSTLRAVPSTPGVVPSGPTVVQTTSGWVPNTPVAEPQWCRPLQDWCRALLQWCRPLQEWGRAVQEWCRAL